MTVGELCVRNVITAAVNESVVDAARRMAAFRVGDLVVVEDQPHGMPKPIGIVTDRDLVIQVLTCPDRVPSDTTIAEVMRGELVTATEDEEVDRVVERMRDREVRRIPVVDRHGGLQGLLSIDDVLGWLRDQLLAATKLIEHQADGPLRYTTHW
jgi:CBS domain-containing protein